MKISLSLSPAPPSIDPTSVVNGAVSTLIVSSPSPILMVEPAAIAAPRVTVSSPAPASTATLAVAIMEKVSSPEPVFTLTVAAFSVPRFRSPVAAEPSMVVRAVRSLALSVSAASPVMLRDVAAVEPVRARLLLSPEAFTVMAVALASLTMVCCAVPLAPYPVPSTLTVRA